MKRILIALLMATLAICGAPHVQAQITVSLSIFASEPPPELPVYEQPECPADGYLWTPGYWAYGDEGYYWVPGVWLAPPQPGYLWTPAYWGYDEGRYGFHEGYWGRHVGFYGGIHYGYGYEGEGFYGGRWEGNSFRYNTAVVNVNRTVVRNVYVDRSVHNTTIINNNNTTNNTVINNHKSFNGPGGVTAKPRPEEQVAMHEEHVRPLPQQVTHEEVARHDRGQLAKENHGRPAAVAMNRVDGKRFDPKGRTVKTPPQVNNPDRNKPQAQQPTAAPVEHPAPAQNRRPGEDGEAQRPKTEHPAETNGQPMPAENRRPTGDGEAPKPQAEQPAREPLPRPTEARGAPAEHPNNQPQRQEHEPQAERPAPPRAEQQRPAQQPRLERRQARQQARAAQPKAEHKKE